MQLHALAQGDRLSEDRTLRCVRRIGVEHTDPRISRRILHVYLAAASTVRDHFTVIVRIHRSNLARRSAHHPTYTHQPSCAPPLPHRHPTHAHIHDGHPIGTSPHTHNLFIQCTLLAFHAGLLWHRVIHNMVKSRAGSQCGSRGTHAVYTCGSDLVSQLGLLPRSVPSTENLPGLAIGWARCARPPE